MKWNLAQYRLQSKHCTTLLIYFIAQWQTLISIRAKQKRNCDCGAYVSAPNAYVSAPNAYVSVLNGIGVWDNLTPKLTYALLILLLLSSRVQKNIIKQSVHHMEKRRKRESIIQNNVKKLLTPPKLTLAARTQ